MHRSSIVNLFSGAEAPQEEDHGSDLGGADEEAYVVPEAAAVELCPRHHEQASILSFAMEMRHESCFCDVSFVVNGSIFRGHRVIVRCVFFALS